MEMNVCRIINAYIQSGRIANPTERMAELELRKKLKEDEA